MNRITLALLCFIAVSFIHSPVFAQNEEEATEASGGIIQRYGRNAANGISSISFLFENGLKFGYINDSILLSVLKS